MPRPATLIDADVEYRDVPGWPGYLAYADGTIWTCWTLGNRWHLPVMDETRWWQQIPTLDARKGYLAIRLRGTNRKRVYLVHQVVALAFYGPRPDGMEVGHENGIPADNRVSNLRYKTNAENQRDRVRHGTHNRGEQHPLSTLTDETVRAMKAEHDGGVRSRDIAAKYGIRRDLASRILRGARWKHITAATAHAATRE